MAKKKSMTKTTGNGNAKAVGLIIAAPNFQVVAFLIRGDSPYVQNKFSEKARKEMHDKQEAGSTAKKGTKRESKNFKKCYEDAMYKSKDGWHGIPAPAFRNACISACRVCGFQMTKAKLSIVCLADGFDPGDGTPLVKITKGKPKYSELPVRNATGVIDLRARPMWDPGWEAVVRLQFDADQFTLQDVTNLLHRVGKQVGIGEGRPDSKQSNGMGWGTFEIVKK